MIAGSRRRSANCLAPRDVLRWSSKGPGVRRIKCSIPLGGNSPLKFSHIATYRGDCSTTERRWSNVSLSHAARGKPDGRDPRRGESPRLTIRRDRLTMEGPPGNGRPFAFGALTVGPVRLALNPAPTRWLRVAPSERRPSMSHKTNPSETGKPDLSPQAQADESHGRIKGPQLDGRNDPEINNSRGAETGG